ncbi:MAG: twin-arginine translocation signal domain-containing protein, partial [Candidatus Marinimicrobia bacterium]|nr:twin-arginine translocation signal domain-containing protein [Candidatus Neomarinimicrobiota bacterium]
MNLERRDFLKVLSAGALTAGNVTSVFAGIRKTLSADAVGILYDGTICIGCKACEAACKQYNDMPPESANL